MEQTGKAKHAKCRAYFGSAAFIQDLITAAMGALTGRIAIFGGAMPFCTAFIAACAICGRSVHIATLAAAAVMVWMRPIPLASLSMCALLYALLMLFARCKRRFDRFDRLLLLMSAQVALMPVFYRGSMVLLLRGVIALGISVIAALVMQNALRALHGARKRHVLTDGEQMSISALFGVLLLAVSDVAGFGFSLSVALLIAFSMVACYARGIAGVSAAVALACVLTVGGFKLPFVGSVAACALLGAALHGFHKPGVIGGFVAASLLLGTYVYTDAQAVNLRNLAAASVLLILVPKEKLLALCGYLDANRERERYAQKSVMRMRAHVAKDMRHCASVIDAMAKLYEKPVETAETGDVEAQWMAQAAFGVCVDCPLKKVCWRDYPLSSAVTRTLAHAYARGEGIRPTKPFDPACRNLLQMAAAACHAQNQYGVQQAMEKQQRAQHAFMCRQLRSVSGILERLASRAEKDRWLDEELEELLLAGLDRRGFRVYGADALFPDGKLMLQLRVLRKQLYQLDPLTEAAQQVLRRPLRLLRAEPEGNYSTLVLEEAQSFCATMGAATAAKTSGGVSGDCVGERRMERGHVLYAVSDGMGTGEDARAESDAALALLFDLYEAGFTRDVALESVNRLLLSKGKDMYATLDAVHIDLKTGDAEFMKYGAPPSFIYRGKSLHTVQAEALPAGILHEAIPAIAKTKLRRDDAIILFSDGVLDALGEGTGAAVGEALSEAESSQEAAKLLLSRARQLRREDDMTVMVIRIA